MIRRADKILVFDLELTCWDGTPPDGMFPEIIQIGWCFLNPKTGERSGRDMLYVKPENSTISTYCTDLTGITPADVRRGQSLAITSARMTNMGMKQYATAVYGDDWDCVKKECEFANCDMFLSDECIDVATLTKLAFNSYKNVGLRRAVEAFGLPWEGQEHSADWDAWNTAGLLGAMLTSDWRKLVL